MINAYACYNKFDSIRMASSSGGVYTSIAENIIQKKGCVFAASYSDNLDVIHMKCETIEQLEKTRGSKYVASHLNDSFRLVKAEIMTGREVLFVGTPCQCAGLKAFLGKDYNNLFLVDFVCHGIPSRLAWSEYKKSLERKGFFMKAINMRDKTYGWKNYRWKMTDNNKVIYESKNSNLYMKGFVADLYLRPSCYNCDFKGIDRVTDFTLGDYWGVQNYQPEMDDDKGTSLLLIHTEKAKKLFDNICADLEFVEADIEKAIKHNGCMVKAVGFNDQREVFFKRIKNKEDFCYVVSDMTKVSLVKKIKQKISSIIYKIVRR